MNRLIQTIILFFAAIIIGLTPVEAQQLEELRAEIKQMKKDNSWRDSIEFQSAKYLILKAVEERKNLVLNFDVVLSKIETDGLYAKLIDANNPASDILGTSYVKVVNQAVEDYLTNEMGKDDKPRFLDVVSKIVKNPIISTILQSNPISGVVSSITNAAADFFNNTPIGKTVKQLKIKTDNIIGQTKLDNFNKELAPYILFYDNMINTNSKYLLGIDQLQNKYTYLQDEVTNFSSGLLEPLSLDINSTIPITEQVQKYFTLTTDGGGFKNYRVVLNDDKIIRTREVASNFKLVETQVNDFKQEYNELLKIYLVENIRLLTEVKNIPIKAGFDTIKIDNLIKDITRYIQSLGGPSKNFNDYLSAPRDIDINAFNN